ncbi:BaiN/RdsA family NAD(P)/FAD-dependent oxidoreductase [Sphingobacterium haloxyli]|uniref:Aminoacetone oxidase family FAD-binding enzyme n=1 Tax=Sphingobacterium haloxyli TaxID=2100533 RepID=A0A2S9J7F1_9SPHI|nr:TIGR03862 family flavoprotein [Sphingobacterium haloxyli]PRD48680.1 aminoacetone oxidase family FAD-binding enzyme [Sphingobacterium haloxyli]
MLKSPIVIVGAGPAGLIAAQQLAKKGVEVHVYEQNKAAARKFLVAGHGGFNLTHSEDIDSFVQNYDKTEIRRIVKYFDNRATVEWLAKLGIPTFIGSSGKVFPAKGIKPIQVLQAVLTKLVYDGVKIHYGYQMVDFDEKVVTFIHQGEFIGIPYYKLILGLGGGSWSKTGSDAKWVNILKAKGVQINALEPANSGMNTKDEFSSLAGQVLKNIQLKFAEHKKSGEIVFTSYGIEGAPVYYLNRFLRQHLFPNRLFLDLKPTHSMASIEKELKNKGNVAATLRDRLKLSQTAIQLLKSLDKETYTNPRKLALAIKNFSIEVTSFRPIDEVISTAGGVSFAELSASLELLKYPNVFCVGEMLDWEAPTGGYLLQACFSSGVWVADNIK